MSYTPLARSSLDRQPTMLLSSNEPAALRRHRLLQAMMESLNLGPIAGPSATNVEARSPIGRLPTETIVHILSFVQCSLLDYEYATHPGQEIVSWFRTFNVCRTWRNAVCDAPLLWRDILIGKDTRLELFLLHLERSATAPLYVEFCRTRELAPFLTELSKQLSRLSKLSLEFLSPQQAEALSGFLQNDLPGLTQLRVTFGTAMKDYDYFDEFGRYDGNDDSDMRYINCGSSLLRLSPREHQLPRLRRLWLRNSALDNPYALNRSSLTSLSLRRGESSITLREFAQFMGECKNLNVVLLDMYRFRVDDSEGLNGPETPVTRVALNPTLRWIHLRDDHTHIVKLLDVLIIPVTTHVFLTNLPGFEMSEEWDLELATPILADCLPRDRSGLPVLTHVDRLDINIYARRLYGRYRHPESPDYPYTSFALSFGPQYPPVDLVESILHVFRGSPIVEMTIAGVLEGGLDTRCWASLLGHFRSLRRITFLEVLNTPGEHEQRTAEHPTFTFLRALSEIQPNGRLLCPYLEDLTIAMHATDDYDDKHILQLLASCLEDRGSLWNAKRLSKLRIGLMKPGPGLGSFVRAGSEHLHGERKSLLKLKLGRFVDKIRYGYKGDWCPPPWLSLVDF
ncbi:hypothetical protein PYCCODRAFT_1435705 [Trametes coccinea BRFM310]|uniref:Uncharacterized protein n=1 Tax=Trametes coccinea (strain BRFM310) TaxID=1353009 RepID=A0A1Y2ILN2_TRAC3|nr:hypothetical protein PYCCODRAFT_1435705 [Trametes coccinea BRFM310]